MKAAFLYQPGEIQIKEISAPLPALGEVRVRLRKTGICGSDVHFFNGDRLLDTATIIGHEGLGEIDLLGEGVHHRFIGERVVIEPNIPCGRCRYCLQGKGNICISKRVIGVNEPGCFAEYICLPEAFCHGLPASITDEDAVTIEPMAVAYHALFTAQALPGDAIAVVGLGAIGLLLTQLALALGYRVYVYELQEHKLIHAQKMGATIVPSFADTASLLRYWQQHEVIAVFECAGSEKTASLVAAAAPRGAEIILVGLSEKQATYQPLKMAREGITLLGSIVYHHPFDFQRVIQLIKAGVVKPGDIISGTLPLNNLQQGLSMAATGKETKLVVTITS